MVYPLGENETPLSKSRNYSNFLSLFTYIYGDKGFQKVINVVKDLENMSQA